MEDPIQRLPTTVEIVGEHVSMEAEDNADLYVDTPDVSSLSANQRHATLRIEGDGFQATVDLDYYQAGYLVALLNDRAINNTQESVDLQQFAGSKTGWIKTTVGGELHWKCSGCGRTISTDRDVRELTHEENCPDAADDDRSPESEGDR